MLSHTPPADTIYDLALIGAGIVGLAVARAFQTAYPGKRLLILEKEDRIAAHQTGRNSGVIHSGIYYKPGSLKARLCTSGSRRMYAFAAEHGIAHERCGKVIVATKPEELPRLDTLFERAAANEVEGVERLGAAQLPEYEPHVRGLAGLWVPGTGIIDYPGVAVALRTIFEANGGALETRAGVTSIRRLEGLWRLSTLRGEFSAKALVNCAGLYSDRIALMCGVDPGARIVPFRGEYYSLLPERTELVRNLIYPVPDPAFPFLGVHFTRTVHHGIEAGPNAVLALAREGYRKGDFSLSDTLDTASWPGFQRLAARYWRTGLAEMARSMSKPRFAASLRELIPEVQESDLAPGGAGIRAQAVMRDGSVVDDFLIQAQPNDYALHILNVPSPAATASLAIAEHIVAEHGKGLFE